MRGFVRRVHLWMGLTFGALFVLLGITGSVLVFYPEIDAALHPEIREQAPRPADWDRALATVRAAYPDKAGAWRFEVTAGHGAIPARYYNPPETSGRAFAPMMVWLSPDGGQVLRRDYWGDYAMTFLYDLHYRLLLGAVGGTSLGVAGLVLLLLQLSGLWAWWPRGSLGKALDYKRGAAQSRRLRDQHKLAGLGSLALLFVLTLTGVMLELPRQSDALLAALVGPLEHVPAPVSTGWTGRQIGVAKALRIAQSALPGARIAWIEVPGPGDGAFRFRMQRPGDPSRRFPHSFVWVDQYSGHVLAVHDAVTMGAATTINNWVHPLHDGSFGGLATRILAVLAGLMPLFLFITGWRRWRLRSGGDARARHRDLG